MKIILINPPHPYLVNANVRVPLGLLYIAAVLKDKLDVEILNLSDVKMDNLKIPKADIYGITCTSIDIDIVNKLAKNIKQKYNCKILVGGVGTINKELFNFKNIDSIIVGEAEKTIIKIISDIKSNQLKQLYIGEWDTNLDNIPFPARELYPIKPPLTIISSRGCAFNCGFCASPYLYNHKIRYRSIDNIINEIKDVINKYNVSYFIFEDDNLTIKKSRILEFAKKVKDLNIKWRGMVRVKPLDNEILQALVDSGCNEVAVGVESFDNNVLKILTKGTTVSDNIRALNLFYSYDIKIRLLLMVRTPGQTKYTMKLNKYYLNRVPYNVLACTNFTPIPGSDIYNNPDKYNIKLLNKDVTKYNYSFFGNSGKNKLENIFSINGRTLKEFNDETLEFHDWLLKNNKLNKG